MQIGLISELVEHQAAMPGGTGLSSGLIHLYKKKSPSDMEKFSGICKEWASILYGARNMVVTPDNS